MTYSPSRTESPIFILFNLAESLLDIALLGRHAGLNVKVSSYSPTVECESGPEPPDEAACSSLTGTMQTGVGTIPFVRTGDSTFRRSVKIPTGGKRIASSTHAFLPPSAFSAFLQSDLMP